MFELVTIRAADLSAAEDRYVALLSTLKIRASGPRRWHDFGLEQAELACPPTRNLHLAFDAPSRTHVDAFWRTGAELGLADDGEPGPRPEYGDDYYGGFLHDGANSIEAIHNSGERTRGIVDHLWIRVADLDASRRFYEELVPRTGFRLADVLAATTRHGVSLPARVRFARAGASFSVVDAAPPTEHVRLAFRSRAGAANELHDPDGNVVNLV